MGTTYKDRSVVERYFLLKKEILHFQ